MDRLDEVDVEMLSWWLSERQLPHGGLNGRPEKLADVSTQSAVRVGDATYATPGLLFVLGAVDAVDPEQGPLDRQRQARRVHPVCAGSRDGWDRGSAGRHGRRLSHPFRGRRCVAMSTSQCVDQSVRGRSVPVGISWIGRCGSRVLHACAHHRSQGTQEGVEGTAAKVCLMLFCV